MTKKYGPTDITVTGRRKAPPEIQQLPPLENYSLTPAAIAAAARGDLRNALVASTPGGIERQEKEGQQELVKSDKIPKDMRPGKEAFESLGFIFGDSVSEDDLFIPAKLPAGWKREASEHSMHSQILDEKGRARVSVFYKAAFYDRRADCHLIERFCETRRHYHETRDEETSRDAPTTCQIRDRANGDKVIFESEEFPKNDYTTGGPADRAEEVCRSWLREHYPDCQDPTKYWD